MAARTYLRLRPAAEVLIIDSDSTVGGVWSKERLYPNLVAQVKLGVRKIPRLSYPYYRGTVRRHTTLINIINQRHSSSTIPIHLCHQMEATQAIPGSRAR